MLLLGEMSADMTSDSQDLDGTKFLISWNYKLKGESEVVMIVTVIKSQNIGINVEDREFDQV